jgi:glyceraldehyde-3-phosphate dehydrogenase/erythrose-4-phosphate dehydrogenase
MPPGGIQYSLVYEVSLRMATPTVSEVKDAYQAAAGPGRLSGLLEYSGEPLVSSDILGSPYSCVFDSELTMAHGHFVEVLGWYDNESGYASRLVDPGGHHRSHLGVRLDRRSKAEAEQVRLQSPSSPHGR